MTEALRQQRNAKLLELLGKRSS